MIVEMIMELVITVSVLLIVISGLLFVVGAKIWGKRLLGLTLIGTIFGLAVGVVLLQAPPGALTNVPTWVYVAGFTIAGILALNILWILLSALFNTDIANSAVGSIVAALIIAVASAGVGPFRWMRRKFNFMIGRSGDG